MDGTKVLKIGHPQLRERVLEIPAGDIRSERIQQLIRDMTETMRGEDGAGLAAPQIGVPLRLAVIEILENPRYPDAPSFPLTVLINPAITARSDELETDWEGCLSIPGLRALVPRHAWVEVEAFDETGGRRTYRPAGFIARAFQHEIDHLDGRLYIDRLPDLTSLRHVEEMENERE